VELLKGIHQIMDVASPWIQERRLVPLTVAIHVGFVDGQNKLAIICLKDVQPNVAFSKAFGFFH
jgi:hypothetical protein